MAEQRCLPYIPGERSLPIECGNPTELNIALKRPPRLQPFLAVDDRVTSLPKSCRCAPITTSARTTRYLTVGGYYSILSRSNIWTLSIYPPTSALPSESLTSALVYCLPRMVRNSAAAFRQRGGDRGPCTSGTVSGLIVLSLSV